MRHCIALGRLLLAPLIALGPAAVLWLLAPPAAVATAIGPGLRADDGGVLLVTASTALVAWAVVGWLTIGVLAAVVAAVPGRVGRLGRALADRITPTLLRRLLSGGTLAGLALTPVVLPAAAHAATRVSTSGCASGAPSLDRAPLGCPIAVATPVSTSTPAPTSTPARWSSAPAAIATPITAPAPRHSARPAPRAATVVVRGGDSLWSLARAQLRAAGQPAIPAAVAARWPAWWAANRSELGDDPGLIHPGEVLRTPTT